MRPRSDLKSSVILRKFDKTSRTFKKVAYGFVSDEGGLSDASSRLSSNESGETGNFSITSLGNFRSAESTSPQVQVQQDRRIFPFDRCTSGDRVTSGDGRLVAVRAHTRLRNTHTQDTHTRDCCAKKFRNAHTVGRRCTVLGRDSEEADIRKRLIFWRGRYSEGADIPKAGRQYEEAVNARRPLERRGR